MFFWLILLLTSLTSFLEKPSRIGLLGPLQIMLRSSHCKNTDKPNLGVFRSQRVLDVCEQIKLRDKWHINEGPREQTHKQKSPNKQTSLVPVPKQYQNTLYRSYGEPSTRTQQEFNKNPQQLSKTIQNTPHARSLQNNPKDSSRSLSKRLLKKFPQQSKRIPQQLSKTTQNTPHEFSTTIQKNPSTTLQKNPQQLSKAIPNTPQEVSTTIQKNHSFPVARFHLRGP